jgi:hypothetical protein
MNRELAGQPTHNPEFIDRELLSLSLLYCLHIEHYENQSDDFNIHYIRGWWYGEMIIALAEKDHCSHYKAWQHLMQTRFYILGAGNCEVVDLNNGHEVIDLTKDHKGYRSHWRRLKVTACDRGTPSSLQL